MRELSVEELDRVGGRDLVLVLRLGLAGCGLAALYGWRTGWKVGSDLGS
jgi:hypothetical protein